MARPKLNAGKETVRVHFVADEEWVERLDRWSERRGLNRSEAIRALLDEVEPAKRPRRAARG
ncbi:MAG: ribbon-helix-helix protein, CopG family [Microvirga sp.]